VWPPSVPSSRRVRIGSSLSGLERSLLGEGGLCVVRSSSVPFGWMGRFAVRGAVCKGVGCE